MPCRSAVSSELHSFSPSLRLRRWSCRIALGLELQQALILRRAARWPGNDRPGSAEWRRQLCALEQRRGPRPANDAVDNRAAKAPRIPRYLNALKSLLVALKSDCSTELLPQQGSRMSARMSGSRRCPQGLAAAADRLLVAANGADKRDLVPTLWRQEPLMGEMPCCSSCRTCNAWGPRPPSRCWRAPPSWSARASPSSTSASASPTSRRRSTSSRPPSRPCATAITATRRPRASCRCASRWPRTCTAATASRSTPTRSSSCRAASPPCSSRS